MGWSISLSWGSHYKCESAPALLMCTDSIAPNKVLSSSFLRRLHSYNMLQHIIYFNILLLTLLCGYVQRLLGDPQTFLSREFRSSSGSLESEGSLTKAARGMSDVKLGVICSSSLSARIYRALWNKQTVSVKVCRPGELNLEQPCYRAHPVLPCSTAASKRTSH